MKKASWWIALSICVCLFGFSGYKIYKHNQEVKQNQESVDMLREMYQKAKEEAKGKTEDRTDEFVEDEPQVQVPEITIDSIKDLNGDFVAWLTVDGTAIDYPVVQSTENDKYLNYGYFGEPNPYGAIFMDTSCTLSSKNILIHGHNTFYDHQMFSDLKLFTKPGFLEKNNHITFNEKDWRIVTCFETSVDEESYGDYSYLDQYFTDFSAWLNHYLEKGNTSLDIVPEQVLTLSTCKDYDGNRIVIMAIPE